MEIPEFNHTFNVKTFNYKFSKTFMGLPITTEVVSSSPVHGEVIKFVSDLLQVGGFLRVHQFPPPIKLTAMI